MSEKPAKTKTPLQIAIDKATTEQHPPRTGVREVPARVNTAEEALEWMLTALMGCEPPEREVTLFPPRKWRFDFVYRQPAFIFEVEGGIWMRGGGAHSRPANIERDIEKYNTATLAGFAIYRLTPDMIRDGRAYNLLVKLAIPKKN